MNSKGTSKHIKTTSLTKGNGILESRQDKNDGLIHVQMLQQIKYCTHRSQIQTDKRSWKCTTGTGSNQRYSHKCSEVLTFTGEISEILFSTLDSHYGGYYNGQIKY